MVTARRRAGGSAYCYGMNQTVRILDPFEAAKTDEDDFQDLRASFNPLDFLDEANEEAIDNAAHIAESQIVSEGGGDPFWNYAAQGLLKAVLLHVKSWNGFAKDERTLFTVRDLIVPDQPVARLYLKDFLTLTGDSAHVTVVSAGPDPNFGVILPGAGQYAACDQRTEQCGARRWNTVG